MEIPEEILAAFKPAFRYRMRDGVVTSSKELDQTLLGQEGVVYLRVHRQHVLYVGKCDGKLSHRIQEHLRRIPDPGTPGGKRHLKWAKGRKITNITILAYRPEPIYMFGLPVAVHSGLEAALIGKFQPPYNDRGVKADLLQDD
jgi:hypothetical protein